MGSMSTAPGLHERMDYAPPILPAIAIVIAKNRIGDPAAPAARGSHCALLAEASSRRGPRLARAEIPSEYGQRRGYGAPFLAGAVASDPLAHGAIG
jgi:hypothetical protein